MKIFTLILFIVCVQTINTFGQSDSPPPPSEELMELPTVVPEPKEQEQMPFTWVEQMPEFPGGKEMMYKFISENLRIPDSCSLQGIGGQAIVQFTVDKEGYIIHPKVIRTPQPECGYSEEALRILTLMNEMNPRWSPGMHNGRTVPVNYTLPIKFVL